MSKTFALLSAQGTACLETALAEIEYTDAVCRENIERQFCTGEVDAPIRNTWTDVSDNEAFSAHSVQRQQELGIW